MTCAVALLLTFVPFVALALAYFLPESTLRSLGGTRPDLRYIFLAATGFAGLAFALYFECF